MHSAQEGVGVRGTSVCRSWCAYSRREYTSSDQMSTALTANDMILSEQVLLVTTIIETNKAYPAYSI